jgi:hypothetical protein
MRLQLMQRLRWLTPNQAEYRGGGRIPGIARRATSGAVHNVDSGITPH